MRALPAIALVWLAGCSGDAAPPVPSPTPAPPTLEPTAPDPSYRAEIRRTAYGIPHVKADDWGSLGYGYGYAYARDNFCVAMRAFVSATSRSAEFFGTERGNLASDFVLRLLFGAREEFRANYLGDSAARALALAEGYAAGMNRYLRETGAANLPAGDQGCRDADWVYEIDAVDVWMRMLRILLSGSSDQPIVRRAIFAATGPDGTAATRLQPLPAPGTRARRAPEPPRLPDGRPRQQRAGGRPGPQPDRQGTVARQPAPGLERLGRLPPGPPDPSRRIRRGGGRPARHALGGDRLQRRPGLDPHHLVRRAFHALRTATESGRPDAVPLRGRVAGHHHGGRHHQGEARGRIPRTTDAHFLPVPFRSDREPQGDHPAARRLAAPRTAISSPFATPTLRAAPPRSTSTWTWARPAPWPSSPRR